MGSFAGGYILAANIPRKHLKMVVIIVEKTILSGIKSFWAHACKMTDGFQTLVRVIHHATSVGAASPFLTRIQVLPCYENRVTNMTIVGSNSCG